MQAQLPNSRPLMRTLRLTALIKNEIAQLGKAHKLAQKINEANEKAGTGIHISHRALQRIAYAPEHASLKLRFLTALDVYFTPLGESLRDKPILEKRGLLEVLVEKQKVTFLLASKPRKKAQRHDMSPWDTRSTAVLLGEACKFDVHMEYKIEEVLLKSRMTAPKAATEQWHALLEDDERSLISLGSPLASLASEIMLARMFKREPFKTPPPTADPKERLPFYFVWPPKISKQHRSAFAWTWRELEAIGRHKEARIVKRNKASAMILGMDVHLVPLKAADWEMYGVIVAQRQRHGNVWLVVSGLTGPATNAAATLVRDVDAELPWSKNGNSLLLWQPIKARVTDDRFRKDVEDKRRVAAVEFLGTPRLWPASA